jgi:hypothetical protein
VAGLKGRRDSQQNLFRKQSAVCASALQGQVIMSRTCRLKKANLFPKENSSENVCSIQQTRFFQKDKLFLML